MVARRRSGSLSSLAVGLCLSCCLRPDSPFARVRGAFLRACMESATGARPLLALSE